MIYLYGLVDADTTTVAQALDGYQGLQAPVAVAQAGAWAIVHSAQDAEEILPKRRLMLAHTRVVEQMLTAGPVLPARFGLVAQDLEQTCALVAARQEDITAAFAKIRGAVEVGVRIRFPRDAALAATLAADPALAAERDRLQSAGVEAHYAMAGFGGKLAEQLDRRRGAAQRALLSDLVPRAADHLLRAPEDDTEVLRAEFLIAENRLAEFEAAVQAAAMALAFAADAEPTIQIVGPVPAYNFIQLN
ncbi:MAG: GvpL/GvpF family gas vesicle protein, partial [Pseudomonadota bacterium]